jgi:hypothetical protein
LDLAAFVTAIKQHNRKREMQQEPQRVAQAAVSLLLTAVKVPQLLASAYTCSDLRVNPFGAF